MPYIKQDQRIRLDKLVTPLIGEIRFQSKENIDGEVNYVISTLIKYVYDLSYYDINRAMGVLECAKQEFYRHIAGPYEDKKILQNGDI